jgi:hypothetical protein
MWYLKISPKIFLGVLITFLLCLLGLGFQLADPGYFLNSLVPELTGVAVELIVILLVFNYWQESSRKLKLVTNERRLREYLIFFLRHNFNSLPAVLKVGRFYGEDHDKNQKTLEKLRLKIQSDGLSSEDIESIKNYCKRDADTLQSLLPVASQLTNDHFKSWSRIVHFANNIAKDSASVEQEVTDIIQNIKRFDNASYKKSLYVGAKNV